MAVTFVINFVDPLDDAVSVTFSDKPLVKWSVPVDKTAPATWQQTISDWYKFNRPSTVGANAPALMVTINVL